MKHIQIENIKIQKAIWINDFFFKSIMNLLAVLKVVFVLS